MSGRFSKAKVVKQLRQRAYRLAKENGFNLRHGWGQVHNEGEEANRKYQEARTSLEIADWIESGSIGT
jgi:hypothetical protein